VIPPLEQLVPHRGPALLLDRVVETSGEETVAETTIAPDMQYVRDGKVDASVALELMAQTVAAHVGMSGRWRDGEPGAGYVIGVPKMEFFGGDFEVGAVLRVTAKVIFHDGPVGRFEGAVFEAGEERARGNLTVYEPKKAEAMMEAAKES